MDGYLGNRIEGGGSPPFPPSLPLVHFATRLLRNVRLLARMFPTFVHTSHNFIADHGRNTSHKRIAGTKCTGEGDDTKSGGKGGGRNKDEMY